MKSGIRSISVPGLALLAMVSGWIAYGTVARNSMQARQPTVVAVVRLVHVFEGLEQRVQMENDLGTMGAATKAKAEEMQKKINEMETAMQDEVDEQRITALQDELNMAKLRFGAWSQMVQRENDIEVSLRLQSLYTNVRNAARQLALAEGIDLILIDNSAVDTLLGENLDPKLPREPQILARIEAQRMLYATREIDVTDQLIQRMNNAFRLGANRP